MQKSVVITTINQKSIGITKFEERKDWQIIIVGDKKSAFIESSDNLTFLSVEQQKELGFRYADLCPLNHYARKNIGYLYAIQHGADVIFDTDDDNIPYDFWGLIDFKNTTLLRTPSQFVNIYKYFCDELIWPRGYPLDEIRKEADISVLETQPINIGVWQGLADIEPDVDAIFRLIFDHKIKFQNKPPVFLSKGCYSPFNSQNSLWQKTAFPGLYLPATVSFRFTDILRGYVAQPIMWKQNLHLGFTSATVYQDRNVHDLMRDFSDEITMYTGIKQITNLLDQIELSTNSFQNLELIYESLFEQGYVKQEELLLCRAWLNDMGNLANTIKENRIHG